MKEAELSSALVRFGVTKQEADLFVLLSKVRNSGAGGVSGREIAGLSKGGRVRTYQVLQRLAGLGLVEVEPGRPKRYLAVSPEVGVRRLLSIQESRVTELSHLEEEVAVSLSKSSPISMGEAESGSKEKWNATVVHGVSGIQTIARKAMADQDLRLIVNDESEGHVFTTVRYMSRKPRSARVIFATSNKRQRGFGASKVEVEGYPYRIKIFHGDLPTIVLSQSQCLLVFYASRRFRPKPLSPVTVSTGPSDCIVVDSPKFIAQMGEVFEAFWKAAEFRPAPP